MEEYFEYLKIKKNKIHELKRDIYITKNKIYKLQIDIEKLNNNYINILPKIEELTKVEKEKNIKDIFITTISTFIFLIIMVYLMLNSFNINLIKIVIETFLICLSGFVTGTIGVIIIKEYFKIIRKNNALEITNIENEEKSIEKNIIEKNLELIKLQEQEKLFLFELNNEENLYNNIRNKIKEKCIPILDELIIKEMENKTNNVHSDNLILIRKVLHGEL